MPDKMAWVAVTGASRFMPDIVLDALKLPAMQLQAQTKVDVLTVHVIALIEASQRAEYGKRDHPECSAHPIGMRIGLPQQPTACQRPRRHRSAHLILNTAVGVEQTRKDAASVGRLGSLAQALPQGSVLPGNIGVEHRQQFAVAHLFGSAVVVSAESLWSRVDDLDQCEGPARCRCPALLRRQVVGQDHPLDHAISGACQLHQQRFQKCVMPVAHDRHRHARKDAVGYRFPDGFAHHGPL